MGSIMYYLEYAFVKVSDLKPPCGPQNISTSPGTSPIPEQVQ